MKNAYSISISARAFKLSAWAVLALLAFTPHAFSQAAAAPAGKSGNAPGMGKIAVVDLQFLVSESKAGKSIRDQLDKQRKIYAGQIEKQEGDLRAAEKQLVADQSKLSKEDFQKRRDEFGKKVMDAQRGVQQRRQAFDKGYTGAMEKLRERVVKIVADIAGKNDIALVLNRQEVVLVDAKMDLTKEVIGILDSQVSTIPVTIK